MKCYQNYMRSENGSRVIILKWTSKIVTWLSKVGQDHTAELAHPKSCDVHHKVYFERYIEQLTIDDQKTKSKMDNM